VAFCCCVQEIQIQISQWIPFAVPQFNPKFFSRRQLHPK
jgi:hypothetical protein